tara:strand:+ start:773 stop:1096 length:324 start_codon:yes stop_codon:yes gene_type:complete
MTTLEQMTQEEINTAMSNLNKYKNADIKSFIRNFNSKSGFIWSSDPMMKKVWALIPPDNHSGCSYAIMLRTIQSKLIRKHNDYIKKCLIISSITICIFAYMYNMYNM